MAKYNAEKIYFSFKARAEILASEHVKGESIIFDSRFEFNLYQKIREYTDEDIVNVHPTYKCVDTINIFFSPDFVVNGTHKIAIEAKGCVTADFPFRLFLFLKTNP
jgi:hypothetical protein